MGLKLVLTDYALAVDRGEATDFGTAEYPGVAADFGIVANASVAVNLSFAINLGVAIHDGVAGNSGLAVDDCLIGNPGVAFMGQVLLGLDPAAEVAGLNEKARDIDQGFNAMESVSTVTHGLFSETILFHEMYTPISNLRKSAVDSYYITLF